MWEGAGDRYMYIIEYKSDSTGRTKGYLQLEMERSNGQDALGLHTLQPPLSSRQSLCRPLHSSHIKVPLLIPSCVPFCFGRRSVESTFRFTDSTFFLPYLATRCLVGLHHQLYP